MAITKEQWAEIEAQLSRVLGTVHLVCDGYKVNTYVKTAKMKLVIEVYVDGFVRSEWVRGESEIPRRFHQEKKFPIGGPRMRAWYLKESKSRIWSKEVRADYAKKAAETFSLWYPYWTNAKAFCRHLRKTCTSIEIVKIGY